ncbi:MAG: glycine betaine ABC transporter substrate-binding protein [Terriglobia bacterium]
MGRRHGHPARGLARARCPCRPIVVGNSTDGDIPKLDFTVLEDDHHYFPPYDAVPVVREDTLKRFSELRPALRALVGKLSAEEMRPLNHAVDGEHQDVIEVMTEFLRAKKLVTSDN